MATEIKTRRYTKEQLVSYLEKHSSNVTEAANIAGTSPRTLNRYLAEGVIPSEWYAKITAALKDRKPTPKTVKTEIVTCSGCDKKLTTAVDNDRKTYNCDADALKGLGVDKAPNSGWHWFTNTRTGAKTKMYPICEKCWNKLEEIRLARKKTVKGKITTKKK